LVGYIKKEKTMDNKRYVLIEVTEEEEKENNERREEFLLDRSVLRKIPISINEVNPDDWQKAFSIAAPHESAIFSLFHFYEDGKAEMRCN
jgi:hypothetical protein